MCGGVSSSLFDRSHYLTLPSAFTIGHDSQLRAESLYYLAHSARGDVYRRLGRSAEARPSYGKALALTK